ncbi:MAG: hypothetical protein A2086_11730 [Spirochaetes bacterium GWD1_27_9]|nr:MAG: hypothetical protein A2Z98_02240 [Spirochaetes bacterium GWB1_27_13]OHD28632.1 MAG: hypothetical protein A2086_11730 [Spirochaetes bacterium GWD1_27_9]
MSKDMFSQQTGKFITNENVDTNKMAKINAKSTVPRLEVAGQTKELSNKAFGIGREKTNQLIVGDTKVSRHHAVVTFENGVAYIKDTDSTNGTYINGQKLVAGKKYQLKNGDKIKIGTTVINFLV